MNRPLTFLATAALSLAGCSRPAAPPAPEATPKALAIPEQGAYTGAYLDFGDTEDDVTPEQIEDFESSTGRQLAIVASSSYWGEQSFPTRNLDIITRHGSIPLIYWSPWDKPYLQDKGPDRFSLSSILAGQWDQYIDQWADGARVFGRPLLVAWGLEMNGTWFPWSGYFYGAGKDNSPSAPGPALYQKAYRYVVDRVRARGASNISWVFQTNNQSNPSEDWNTMRAYYPGDNYVDWLGLSAYGMQFKGTPWERPESTFIAGYQELAALSPNKPIMLAEWGVGEFPASGDKAQWITDAFRLMETRMPRLKAAVFWHERWQNDDGSFSNLRVTSSPQAVEAYGESVASPFWLDRPTWLP